MCTGIDLLTKFDNQTARKVDADGGFFELVYAAPHCHAPACARRPARMHPMRGARSSQRVLGAARTVTRAHL